MVITVVVGGSFFAVQMRLLIVNGLFLMPWCVLWAATTTVLLNACASLKGMLTGKSEELRTADIFTSSFNPCQTLNKTLPSSLDGRGP